MTETVSDERLREFSTLVPQSDIDREWNALCELTDRTSPEEYPDHCLISKSELHAMVCSLVAASPALRTPPQNTDGEAVAWEGYWPGAGSVDSVTKVTHHRHVMESWHLSGAEITHLVPASALSAMKAERDAAERTRELMAADWLQFCETMGVQFDTQEAVASDLLRKLSAAEAERDALLADSTDKAQAWDAIAEKNATIAALKADLTRYIDIANAEANEAESLRAQVALHRKDSSDYLDALVRERARAEKAEAERDALAKALGGTCWRSCTGCHETNEGAETGNYPYSKAFGCYLGAGCDECGGIGVVLEYGNAEVTDEMARALIRKYRELWPGGGWPPLKDAKALLIAAFTPRSTLQGDAK